MKYILKNKQFHFLMLLTVIVAIFLADSVKTNFLEIYIGNLSNISIRYFLIILSVAIEYITYKTLHNSCIIFRNSSKSDFFQSNIEIEMIIGFIVFITFNLIVLFISLPTSLHYIIDIIISSFNMILIYITVSLIIKIFDICFSVHYMASVAFLFIYTCIDFILEYFNFFIFNNKLFNLETIFIIFYTYKNSLFYFLIIIIFDIIIFKILTVKMSRKDFILKYDEEI